MLKSQKMSGTSSNLITTKNLFRTFETFKITHFKLRRLFTKYNEKFFLSYFYKFGDVGCNLRMKLLFFIFLLIIRNTISSRILFIWTFPAKSHVIIAQGLSTVLAEKGHNVTFVSAFPLSEPVANHREIQLPIDETLTEIIEEIVKNPKRFFLWSLPKLLKILVNSAQNLLDMPEFKKLMSDEKFDLVIVGISDKYLLGVADHFKCPSIVFGISHPGTVLNILIGNPMEIHAVPHFYTTSKKMQFCDRLKNFVWYSLDLLWNAFSQSQQKKIYK